VAIMMPGAVVKRVVGVFALLLLGAGVNALPWWAFLAGCFVVGFFLWD